MKHFPFLIVSSLIWVALSGCSTKNNNDTGKGSSVPVADVGYEVSEDKESLTEYYKLDHIREWYPERILPPVFDFDVDLSNKSVVELWLLRNEIFARNGYLFDDAVLRGHFNQYKWYQPIFDVEGFTVQLNRQEQQFVDKVLKREQELIQNRYVQQGQYKMISMDHVYNTVQFKVMDANLKATLSKNNFAVVPAEHEQLFHVYDNNHYDYTPNFITTDIYLQVLHKHFSSLLQNVEEEKFIPLLTTLLANLYDESATYSKSTGALQDAGKFSTTYLAIAYSLITNKIQAPGDPVVKQEIQRIMSYEGQGSAFLGYEFIQYSQFKPRGNYRKTPELESYFRCMKWLNTAPIVIEEDNRLLSAILIAALIKKDPQNLQSFTKYNDAIKFIVGDEDNLSIGNLVSMLSSDEADAIEVMNDPETLNNIRKKLSSVRVDKIRTRGADEVTEDNLAAPSILFTAGRYTFDAEILGRLIHVLRPDPKRPFPKGLDVFASLGNSTANHILLDEYAEQSKWPAFTDTLKILQAKFSNYTEWDKNIYAKTFETISALSEKDEAQPLFMKTSAWSRKNLSTSLAAWTELKHDMLLYAEQPGGAQAGEGGGPPPPMHISYVEPNVTFWQKSLDLIDFQEKQLIRMDLLTDGTKGIIEDLREIGRTLLAVSKKELAHQPLTVEEFDYLSYLGGRIEYLTFRIFGSDHLPEKERVVALVADVYNYNGVYLEEAVGMIDEIYVIAEINGKPYLTKGAVLSYYEFNSEAPLSDEEWRARLTSGGAPPRPAWLKEIMVKTPSLETKSSFSF
jgi:hypothetical protein